MASKGPYLPGARSATRARQEAVERCLRSEPLRPWTRAELYEAVRRHARSTLVDSALLTLIRLGRVEIATRGSGGRGSKNTYRAVVGKEKAS